MSITTLNKLPINSLGKVNSIKCTGELRRRLLDLGVVEGTSIKSILKSPLNDPTAYEIRGALIAIRECDSKFINIEI